MKDHGVSTRVKDIIAGALSQRSDQTEEARDRPSGDLSQVVDTLIHDLDSAGFVIEMKAPMGADVRASDIGVQAIKMKRAEAAVKEWLTEQRKNGVTARADHAPGWNDYQREHDNFNSAIARIENA